jgi:hypothetical protein
METCSEMEVELYHSWIRQKMEGSGQFYTPAALLPGKSARTRCALWIKRHGVLTSSSQ